MGRLSNGLRLVSFALLLSVLPALGQEQPDSPLPPGVKATILPLKGKVLPLKVQVLPIKGQVLPIKGVAAAVSGRVVSLAAAIQNLRGSAAGVKVTESPAPAPPPPSRPVVAAPAPAPAPPKREVKIYLPADVLFDFDKADLRPEATPVMQRVAQVLMSDPQAFANIDGHTDGKGNDRYNQVLSERRAETVRAWLVANGVTAKLVTHGFGKTRPVAPNTLPNGADNPEGRQQNRRVEITFVTTQH